MNQPVDLYLLGTGIAFPDHLTIDTMDIMSRCAAICTNLPENRVQLLPDELRRNCISLWPLYQDRRLRRDNYNDVHNAVLAEMDRGRPVAWLTQGHPVVFDSVSKALLASAKTRGWTVSVVPAISSLDTLLAELRYDPANGLLVHDASGLVRNDVPLSRFVGVMLLQLSVFQSDRAHLTLDSGAPDLTPLADYLMKFFPSEHPCAVVRSARLQGLPTELLWTTLRDLPGADPEACASATLFVPPIAAPTAPVSKAYARPRATLSRADV